MDYFQAIAYLNTFDRNTIKLGLERMQKLMALLGNPQDNLRFVHVTGTNGKGSTIAMLKSILEKSGYKVGAFTSPHLLKINESIAVGDDIDDKQFAELVSNFATIIEGNSLTKVVTKFEVLTALAINYFALSMCDIVLLEVGLGGLTDSTNIVRNTELAIFTKISLDHVGILGESIADIAKIKSGIIKKGCGVVIAKQIFLEVIPIIKAEADNNLAQVVMVDGQISGYKSTEQVQSFSYKNYKNIVLKLLGQYQTDNALTAITAAEYLSSIGYNIADIAIFEGLKTACWQCRMEKISDSPTIYVDGGHNIDGINAVYEFFANEKKCIKFTTIFGVLKDKEYANMIAKISKISQEVIAVDVPNPRALSKEIIAQTCLQCGIKAKAMSLEGAVEYAIDKGGDILIIGSLYYVGEAKKIALERLGGLND